MATLTPAERAERRRQKILARKSSRMAYAAGDRAQIPSKADDDVTPAVAGVIADAAVADAAAEVGGAVGTDGTDGTDGVVGAALIDSENGGGEGIAGEGGASDRCDLNNVVRDGFPRDGGGNGGRGTVVTDGLLTDAQLSSSLQLPNRQHTPLPSMPFPSFPPSSDWKSSHNDNVPFTTTPPTWLLPAQYTLLAVTAVLFAVAAQSGMLAQYAPRGHVSAVEIFAIMQFFMRLPSVVGFFLRRRRRRLGHGGGGGGGMMWLLDIAAGLADGMTLLNVLWRQLAVYLTVFLVAWQLLTTK